MAGHFLQIGGISIALRSPDQRIRWQWNDSMRRFLVPAQEQSEVEIDVAVLDQPIEPAGEELFESGGVWRMLRDGDGYRLECRSESLGADAYMVARFDSSFTRGTILIAPGVLPLELSPLDYPLDEVLVASLLGRGRGVELHSCGVIDSQGRGHLFVGVSGAGKSTTAQLWEGASRGIVSDDRVIVREHDGAMWMYGTPWHGEAELSLATRVPLVGVYLLEQSDANEIRPLLPATAVARLFRCAFPPFYDAAAVDFTLEFLERMTTVVPVRELRFTRDRSVVDMILGGAAA